MTIHSKKWIALAIGLGGAAAIGVVAVRRTRRSLAYPRPITAVVTIKKPPRAVYELFRDFSRLPEFMTYLEKVQENGELSTWTAVLPVLGKVSWKARIIDDIPGQLLSWRSEPGSSVQTRGRVTFTTAPGRESTEVRVEMQLGFLGRPPSAALARWLASPEVKGDLRRLKQVLETGEVLRSDASAHARPHPAQPAHDAKRAPDFFIPHNPNVEKEVAS
jgi:uncharacterized membrane protein